VRLAAAKLAEVAHLPVRVAAQQLGVSVNTYQKACRAAYQETAPAGLEKRAEIEAA